MSKRNSIILGLLFVILIVEIIILAPKEIGTSPDGVATKPPPAITDAGGQIMQNVYSVEAKKDGKEWELWADKALRPKENQEWTIERVKVKFYASNGVTYTVTGKTGRVVPNEKGIRDINITGNVITKASNGYVFKSESVFYDSENKRLSAPSEVEMTSPADKNGSEMQLTGGELKADFASNEILVNKRVKARRRVKNDKLATIQSDSAKFGGRTQLAQFNGNVEIDYDGMTINGPEAKFAYDSQMEALQSVIVGGGVKVSDASKFATSQSVAVDFRSNRVVFKGAPKVMQNGDELVGDEIVFLDGGRKVEVVNARAQLDPNAIESRNSGQKVETKN